MLQRVRNLSRQGRSKLKLQKGGTTKSAQGIKVTKQLKSQKLKSSGKLLQEAAKETTKTHVCKNSLLKEKNKNKKPAYSTIN